MLQKNDIAWYYTKENGWKRGKIRSIPTFPFSTRPIGLLVKPNNGKPLVFVSMEHKAIDGALSRPTAVPPIPWWNTLEYKNYKHKKLYKKLGFL